VRTSWLILALFLLTGFAYSMVTPAFETPDEPFHYAFARHIAQGNGLPVQDPHTPGPWAQEGSQAPLYYILTGIATTLIDQGDFAQISVHNPRANIGDPLYPGNKNFMLHSGQWRPLHGANLALHIGRWISLLMGAITLWSIHRLACFVFPHSRTLPLAAMAFAASIPQFIFLSASFSNDNAVIAASSFTLFWLARLLAKADDAPIHRWEWSVLGVVLGLAALSKLQGLGLIPLSGLVVLFLAWRRRAWRILPIALIFVGAPTLLIAGWWYWRNIALYGDWSGLSHLMEINGRRQTALTWKNFWPEFAGLRYSAWGIFGWFNILLPDWFYKVMDLLTIAGLLGALLATAAALRTTRVQGAARLALRPLLLLWLWLGMMAVLLLYWTMQATGSQGRLLFPALASVAILLTVGFDFWLRWLPPLVQRGAAAGLLALLVGMSFYALGWLLPTAYYAARPVNAASPHATPVDVRYGIAETIRLLAVAMDQERVRVGESVPVTLYWQSTTPLDQDYQLFLQLLDENGVEIANLTTHPGWGRNPTTFWTPGALYADRYLLRVTERIDDRSPLAARLYVGFIDPTTEASGAYLPLPAFAATGEEITPFVGAVVVEPLTMPQAGAAAIADGSEFGNVIRLKSAETVLDGVAADGSAVDGAAHALDVNLLWEAIGTPATDYTLFVHVLDDAGNRVGGFDQAPAGDRFPTHLWRAGDHVVSRARIAFAEPLAPGEYGVWVGLYESASAGVLRLPITKSGRFAPGDGQVQVETITVE
jgi:4-amino-4-deoxy-L-arabinose transferase-like glycosyltransferase